MVGGWPRALLPERSPDDGDRHEPPPPFSVRAAPKSFSRVTSISRVAGSANYDVFPDGQRFSMMKSAGQNDDAFRLRVIVNWPDLLKRRDR